MFGHETRIAHFITPILFILLGGWMATFEGWQWLWTGILIWLVSLGVTLWLVVSGILLDQRLRVDSDANFYDLIHNLTDEEKVMAGLLPQPKDQVRIEQHVEGSTNWKFNFLSISPAKLKTVAYACTNGTPFALRALAGKDKILSDQEWRTLKDELLEYGYIKPRSEKDDRQGFDWTEELGKQLLRDVLGLKE